MAETLKTSPESTSARRRGGSDPGLSFGGFVALMASIMVCNQLGVDAMLPALPIMTKALHIPTPNDAQLIIAVYMLGFGAAQLIYGPLADRFGRRPIILISLVLNCITSFLAGLSTSFGIMLAARLLQGVSAAAGRVLVTSIVRDCYEGRQMARVMSLAFIIFLAVPILAPSIGQALMLFVSWRYIFFFMSLVTGGVAIVVAKRLNETLHPEFRRPISFQGISHAVQRTVTDRSALGYMLAGTVLYGALMGYLNMVQLIFTYVFKAPEEFPVMFAFAAGAMGVAAFLNARIVVRLGTRRVSQSAMVGFLLVAGVHVIVAATGHENAWTFSLLQVVLMFCFGLMSSNFNAMAMESMGEIAGTAASVQGFVQTCGGTLIGVLIGRQFNGTTMPSAMGFLVAGLAAFAIVLVTERGRLFQPHHPSGV